MANDAELRIGGNIDDLKAATDKATAEVRHMASQMESSLGSIAGVFSKTQALLAGFSAVMAGGLGFQKAINATKEQSAEAMTLARQLGITASEANVLSTALGNVFVSHDAYSSAVHAVTRAINKNADGFKDMGVSVKDSSGQLRPMQDIITDTVKALEQYKAGADRNIMANQLLGKNYEDLLSLMKVTPKAMQEAREEVDAYHKQIDPAAVKRYKEALENAGDAVEGVTLAVGRGAMPIFAELSEWFSQVGPAATEMTIVAMGALGDAWEAVKSVAISLWDVISNVMTTIGGIVENTFGVRIASASETFVNVFRLVRAAVQVFAALFEGAFEAIRGAVEVTAAVLMAFSRTAVAALTPGVSAGDVWAQEVKKIEAVVEASAKRIAAIQKKYSESIPEALAGGFGSGPSDKPPPGGNKSATISSKPGAGSATAEKSRMGVWDAQLIEARLFYQKTHEMREYSKTQEKEYWESILRQTGVTGQERIAITKKVSELELEIMKKKLQQQKELDAQAIGAHEKRADDSLKMEELFAQREYDLGSINKEELLALQMQYEARRTAIQQEAQAARISAMLGDPNMDPVALQKLLDQMAELQRAGGLRVAKLNSDAAVASRTSWESALAPIGAAFDKTITGMIMGTTTFKKGLSNLLNSIMGEFVNMCVKMLIKWTSTEIAKSMATKEGSFMRSLFEKMGLLTTTAVQETASDTTVATKAGEATAVVSSNAAEAASGAAASVSSIPIAGWAMAAGVFAATLALVMGAKSSIKSASGGYDIPSGVNPVTQLHSDEMVLPAHIANPLRDSLGGGGIGGGGGLTIHVNSASPKDMVRALKDGGALHKALKDYDRRFMSKS